MSESITIAGHTYRVGEKKLSAMDQFHVTRRLGPALVVCGVTFQMMMEGAKVSMEDWMNVAGPVMEIVSRMSDEDIEYVIYTCLRVCERESGSAWAPVVTNTKPPQIMFADMDQAELIRLTVEVLRANLTNFAKGMNVGGNSAGG